MSERRRRKVVRKIFMSFWIIIFIMGFSSLSLSYTTTGILKGKIIDSEGLPLSDAFIYLSSPAMQGIRIYITSETGNIFFPYLPPGKYRIRVEMPGFKTISVENIIIKAGKTIDLHIPMEATSVEEEISKEIPTPTLDVHSAKIAAGIEQESLRHIPFPRILEDAIASAPGVITERVPFQKRSFLHGSPSSANTFSYEGFSMCDAGDRQLLVNLNFDTIEEIEVETAGHPAEAGLTDGGFINIVTKSGSNKMDGSINLYHTRENLSSSLRHEDELSGAGISPPAIDKGLWDTSLSLSGMIFEDIAWFFGNARFISQKQTTPFISWTDPLGNEHPAFNRTNEDIMASFKLSGRYIPHLNSTLLFNYSNRYRSVYEPGISWNTPEESTHISDREINLTGIGIIGYALDQNTYAELKAGYTHHKLPLRLKGNRIGNPEYFDSGTGHLWGNVGFNENRLQRKFQVTASMTRFQEDVLGGDHELKAGAEYEYAFRESTVWRINNLSINYFFGNHNYFGQDVSPSSGFLVDKGLVSFFLAGGSPSDSNPQHELRRFSFYAQDSMTFLKRLTLYLGLRFERSQSELSSYTKSQSGNYVSYRIGENIIEAVQDINPYDEVSSPRWKNMIVWNTLSPRVGLSFDIFGKGKSIFKASFARYKEALLLDYLTELSPINPYQSHQFFWFDEDMDSEVDGTDTYVPYPDDYRLYSGDNYKRQIASGVHPPYTDEWTVGLHQELFSDFSFRVSYIQKTTKNILASVLYALDQDRDWYTKELDTQNWWIPFDTIVPGVDDFSATPVTVYYLSNNAPDLFYRIKNVPELEQYYQAVEFAFTKRMSHKWQLSGSVVFSKTTGNTSLNYDGYSGFSLARRDPNTFVNLPEDSRLDYDTPLSAKLTGTFELPLGFFLSFYYRYLSGPIWTRSVTIVPPSTWAQSNDAFSTPVTVLLEKPGERRAEPYSTLDLRIEKRFRAGRSRFLSFYADIMNVFGYKSDFLHQNDGGFWYPDDENTDQGTRIHSPSYRSITSLLGTRTFRLCLRFDF